MPSVGIRAFCCSQHPVGFALGSGEGQPLQGGGRLATGLYIRGLRAVNSQLCSVDPTLQLTKKNAPCVFRDFFRQNCCVSLHSFVVTANALSSCNAAVCCYQLFLSTHVSCVTYPPFPVKQL